MTFPLVSVVIPAYNHEKSVARAIGSVLGQTYSNLELIVVDDGSADRTWHIIKEVLTNSTTKFQVHTKPNEGVAATLNYGVVRSSGSYIAVLASDDYYLPEKIERQVALFAHSSPTTALVHSGAYLDYGDGKQLLDLTGTYVPAIGLCFKELLSQRMRIVAPSIMVTRDAYQRVGGFDESLVAEDVDFHVAVAARGFEIQYDPAPLVVKTVGVTNLGRHPESIAGVHFKILQKYRGSLSAAEYAVLEEEIYRHVGQAAAAQGMFGLSLASYLRLVRRCHSPMPLMHFLGNAGRRIALSTMPTIVRHRLRMIRESIMRGNGRIKN